VGHVARQDNDRWTRRIVQWRPRQRSADRPQKQWIDDIKEIPGRKWHQMAMKIRPGADAKGLLKEEEKEEWFSL